MNIEHFGKGAIKTPKEIRDKHYRLKLMAARIIDWSKPFSVESNFIASQRDQNGSSSCTSQATCYYDEAKDPIHKRSSARFSYSQNHASGGGAYIWMPMQFGVKTGFAKQDSVPDGDSSETTMTDTSLNKNAVLQAIGQKYAVIPRSNIDQMAGIIEDYGGFVTGFNGKNDMFSPDGTANVFTGQSDWGHCVWVCGHETRNGIKCLKFKNSWTQNWGSNGYGFFPEDFVNSGLMFDCYVYASVSDIDPTSMGPTDAQLNQLYLAVFNRPIDSAGLAFHHGHSWDQVLADLANSPEHKEYGAIYQAVKKLENDIRSGIF